jgi:hypothetical protein
MRRTRSCAVPFKVQIPANFRSQTWLLCDNWSDGGYNEPKAGWVGVAWAYDFKTLFVNAIAKNVELNEHGEPPEDYEYDENKLVFFVDESEFIGTDPIYCFFAVNRQTLEEFLQDMQFNFAIIAGDTVQQTI